MSENFLLLLEKISPILNIVIPPFLLIVGYLYVTDYYKKHPEHLGFVPLPHPIIALMAICGAVFGVFLIWQIFFLTN